MTTDKRGISALLLQRQLELRRYETAWMMLHKLRQAMVNVGASLCVERCRSMKLGWVVPRRVCAAVASLKAGEPLLCWWPLRSAVRHRGGCV
jgi:hypothetical protein